MENFGFRRAKITKSMAKHIEIGRIGEKMAVEHLLHKGYTILEKNWRIQRAEIDILAMDGDCLICIEVKTRSTEYFGRPDEFVGRKKLRILTDAAVAYAQKIDHNGEIRFDILSVIMYHAQSQRIIHLKNVFFPSIW